MTRPTAVEAARLTALESRFAGARSSVEGLLSAILQASSHGGARRILFVAPRPGDGATTIATMTAVGLARNLKAQVTLLELDVEEPGQASALGIPARPGLSDYLDGEVSLEQCFRAVSGVPGLRTCPGGTPRSAIPGELAGERARELFDEIRRAEGFVLIDAPALLGRFESRLALEFVDSSVLVCRARKSHRADCLRAVEALKQSGTRLMGTVLNGYRSDLPFGLGDATG